MTLFAKPPATLAEQLSLWESRGLVIADRERARHYLSVISYYRFSAYTLPLQQGDPDHQFVRCTANLGIITFKVKWL